MYHMILGKSFINIATCVYVCVRACVCVHVWGGGRSSTSLVALYVNLNEAVALVKTT